MSTLRAVLVHYHAAGPAERAVASLRSSGLGPADLLVVDNGSTTAESRRLSDLGVRVLRPERNLGYAAGLRRGVEALPDASALLALNPDVELLPGALAELRRALGHADVVGPRLWWDPERTGLLPPTERRTPLDELLAALARRPGPGRRLARRRWRRHALAHHRAQSDLPSWTLSGAALLLRRDAWDRTGGFDDGYRLYFEESDWLARLRRAGGRSLYVPAAEAIHAWGASARGEPRAAVWFAESCARFRRRHYGSLTRALLGLLERRPPVADVPYGPGRLEGIAWLELSPSPAGFPAASIPVDPGQDGPLRLPEELTERAPPGDLWLRAIDDRGRERALRRLRLRDGQRAP